jgi:hypothetical protein
MEPCPIIHENYSVTDQVKRGIDELIFEASFISKLPNSPTDSSQTSYLSVTARRDKLWKPPEKLRKTPRASGRVDGSGDSAPNEFGS